ncbi:amidohydrolase [Polynucleobacter sp. MWH-UH35A]|uniref:amidohydrolase n=1 Tax=Polynucleobacter sp. MWH-UH35A TaxID=1855619 RepID=UPI001BFCF572|nr:amidohydrolase [Polynucleobacter sp. MWH-UH35A]QWD59549.1 amidohydrolase [Polynucleobacter sp. MWH-UH35A]
MKAKTLNILSKRILFASLAAALLGSANATEFLDPPAVATPKNITVYVAKKVVTMDPSNPVATAVAVSDGKILSVGSLDDLKPWTDKYPTQINRQFADKVIYPGFVDPHEHPLLGGLTSTSYPITYFPLPSPWGKPFPGVKDLSAAIAKLREYSAGISNPNEPLLAWGYDIVAMKKIPNRQLLDEVSTTRPVFVWDSSEHNIFLNSAALKKYFPNPDEVKKVIGVGVDPDGSLNGQFLGASASPLIIKYAGKDLFSLEKVAKALMYSNDIAQQAGITTTSELTFGMFDIEAEKKLMQKFTSSDLTSLRIEAIPYSVPFVDKYGDQAVAQVQELQKLSTDRLFYKGIKFINDDAFLANTMKVNNPGYIDGHQGIMFYPTYQDFAKTLKPWWDAGFQIHVHSNGNEGNVEVANALQVLQDQKPRFDHRFTFEHLGMPSTSVVRKMKVLGAIASVNPSYFYDRAGLQVETVGSDRASYPTRVGQLLREGVPVTLHSDTPVTPPSPLTQAWSVVTRQGLYTGNKKWAPAEAITPEQAMKMVTIDAAYALGLESKVGSIEPGKFADFTVLAADPVTVPKEKIKDVPVIGTVLGGRYIPVSETKQPRPF